MYYIVISLQKGNWTLKGKVQTGATKHHAWKGLGFYYSRIYSVIKIMTGAMQGTRIKLIPEL